MHAEGYLASEFPFDLSLIAGLSNEQFPFQRFSEYAKFQRWLVAPAEPSRIHWASKIAVARALRDTAKYGDPEFDDTPDFIQKAMEHHFNFREVTFGLLTMPGFNVWDQEHELARSDAETALTIASVLLKLDRYSDSGFGPPSVSKAIYLAGFGDDVFYDDGSSRQKAKDLWAEYAPVAPFLLAERWLCPIFDLDDDRTRDQIVSFLSPTDRIYYQRYLEMVEDGALPRVVAIAKAIQNELLRVLNDANALPVRFPPMPVDLAPEMPTIPSFTADENRRLQSYRSDR